MKRRLLSLVMATGLLVSLITGCGKTESSSEKKVTIIFGDQVANVEESSKYLWDVAQEFMKKNPDITIEFQGSDHEDYISKLKMATQSDSLPDVFWIEPSMLSEFSENGYIYDLTEDAKARGIMDRFQDGMLDVNMVDGKLYGFPSEVMLPCYYYNKEIFKKYNLEVPKTWDEFLEVCKVLSAEGVTPIAKGALSNWSVWNWQNIFVRYGFFNDIDDILNGEKSFNNDNFIHAYEKIKELSDAGAYAENVKTIDYYQAIEVFLAGNAAMLDSGNFACRDIENSEIANEVGCFSYPLIENGVTDEMTRIGPFNGPYAVSSKAASDEAKKEAIFKFFEFYYSEEGAQIVANTNMLPTSKFSGTVDAEKNPVFAQIVDLYNEEGWSNQFQPYGYMATNVADTWADSMWGVALGNYTPEEAAEKVEQEIRY